MVGSQHCLSVCLSRPHVPLPGAQGKGMSRQERRGSAALLHLLRAQKIPAHHLEAAAPFPESRIRTWHGRDGARDKGIFVLSQMCCCNSHGMGAGFALCRESWSGSGPNPGTSSARCIPGIWGLLPHSAHQGGANPTLLSFKKQSLQAQQDGSKCE